jgi:hypothetical protein
MTQALDFPEKTRLATASFIVLHMLSYSFFNYKKGGVQTTTANTTKKKKDNQTKA